VNKAEPEHHDHGDLGCDHQTVKLQTLLAPLTKEMVDEIAQMETLSPAIENVMLAVCACLGKKPNSGAIKLLLSDTVKLI